MAERKARRPRRTRTPKKPLWWRLLFATLGISAALGASAVLGGVFTLLLLNDRLPALDAVLDYQPRIPLRVYSADGRLLGEFGQERRVFVHIEDVPQVMKNAVLAAEDTRFFEHVGFDPIGVARAAIANLFAGGKEQGGSTITMQLAREFFLSHERTYLRKAVEILLAMRIENTLSKEQIFELYLNQIYLGKRSYGFAAAAKTYFDKPLADLSAAQAAVLAGLPKAPSRFNPMVNPARAIDRQHYVLGRMRDAGFLDQAAYEAALNEPLVFTSGRADYPVDAPWVAELARQLTWDLFGDDIYSAGLKVYTTIDPTHQAAANAALENGVLAYDQRHGYRGPEDRIELPVDRKAADEAIEAALAAHPDVGRLLGAVVLDADPKTVTVTRGEAGDPITISGNGLKFVASALGPKAGAARRITRGAVVRILRDGKQYRIVQLPQVQASFVSMGTHDGAVRALVGGYDFSRNRFNRVIQAWRQPGSSFKPYVYSAALEKGFMTSTIVDDAPVYIDPGRTGGQLWDPKNYDGQYEGPIPLQTGLARSKNMVSVRIVDAIGPKYVQDYVSRFGFEPARHPPYLTLALGAGSVTPWRMVEAISVFANGGYRIEPYLISRITDSQGRLLASAHPDVAGDESVRAIDARNAFLMDSMLREVVRSGTAVRAKTLGRHDLAGKTGTTNDSIDAWFTGYQPSLAAVAWVGFDQPRKLGNRETGSGAALPIWIEYMSKALASVPEQRVRVPEGVVRIDDYYYLAETTPGTGIASLGVAEEGVSAGTDADYIRDQIF